MAARVVAKFYIAIIIPQFQNRHIIPQLHGTNIFDWICGDTGKILPKTMKIA